MTTLAIDIGGTKLAAALIDTQHRRWRNALPTPASKTPAALTEALSALVAPFAGRPGGSSRLHGHYWSRRTDGVKPG
jgi:N-acylmannosamine kinase